MGDRVFGIETEYAMAPVSRSPAPRADYAALRMLSLAADRLAAVEEAGGRGLFLQNGARFYVDAGYHPEMTTPECVNPWDAVRYVLAGDRILAALACRIGGTAVFKTNVDYEAGTTWGCHESIMHATDPRNLPRVIPHLVSRVVFTGAGGFDYRSPGARFTLSPRVAHLTRVASGESTSSRGIFHLKEESLSGGKYGRLHILCGESLRSEVATWLKVATTVLVVALIEGGVDLGSEVELESPLAAMRAFADDVTCKVRVPLKDGRMTSAVDVQRHLLGVAEAHAGADFMPPWATRACTEWRRILDLLAGAPDSVSTTLDWAIKWALYRRYAARCGCTWESVTEWTKALGSVDGPDEDATSACPEADDGDAWLSGEVGDLVREGSAAAPRERAPGHSAQRAQMLRLRHELLEADMRFAQLGTGDLFAALDEAGVLSHHVEGVDNIDHAVSYPPATGRAHVRGEVIRRAEGGRRDLRCSWERMLNVHDGSVLDLADPLETREEWEPRPARHRAECVPPDVDAPSLRREEALQHYLAGRHADAERLLVWLLEREYDVPSTLCHLARLFVVTDRLDEARDYAAAAWSLRREAPGYVRGRALWFQVLFAFLDDRDPHAWLREMKPLVAEGNSDAGWSMEPVLAHLVGRVDAETHAFLSALVAALCDHTQVSALDRFPFWRDAPGGSPAAGGCAPTSPGGSVAPVRARTPGCAQLAAVRGAAPLLGRRRGAAPRPMFSTLLAIACCLSAVEIGRGALPRLDPMVAARRVVELLGHRTIGARTSGRAAEGVGLLIRTLVSPPIRVAIPGGACFDPASEAAPDTVGTTGRVVWLGTKAWRPVSLTAACTNWRRPCPGRARTYTILRAPPGLDLGPPVAVLDRAREARRAACGGVGGDRLVYGDR